MLVVKKNLVDGGCKMEEFCYMWKGIKLDKYSFEYKQDRVLVLAEARLKGEVDGVLANLREQITKQFGVEAR